ncbi:MAG: glycosyltransferase, partial [Acidobacteria bacterium]|nr:glycosyltransferase [Candidatus Sulfomarinibacter sp. MAG AM1]
MKLSLVLPVFNEAENLRAFFEELLANLDSLEMELEAIFVNDGSRDASLEVMRELKDEFGARVVIVILDLARNFG